MGYRVGRSCYATPEEGMESVVSRYPVFEYNEIYTVGQKSVSPAGLITLRIDRNNAQSVIRNIQLEQCTQSASIEWIDGVLIAAVFVLLWALGFNGGLKR